MFNKKWNYFASGFSLGVALFCALCGRIDLVLVNFFFGAVNWWIAENIKGDPQ